MSAARLLVALVLATAATACGEEAVDTGTGPTTVPFTSAQFSNVIGTGERRFYAFTPTTSGPVTVTLASVTHAETGAPLAIPLRVGVGRPQGTECPPASLVTVPAALQSQLTHLAAEGVYCIDVADPGTVAVPVRFAVRFTHP
jgi:hypothetical protein